MRDFIGTGWYSSEYIVSTKTIGNFELSRSWFWKIKGRNSISNPFRVLSSDLEEREGNNFGLGGTLGTINWFHGQASPFFGFNYKIKNNLILSAEYSPDFMSLESPYLKVNSPVNLGIKYQLNDALSFATEYLYGCLASATAQLILNPKQPALKGGKELAPVPMRLRGNSSNTINQTNEQLIRKVLSADDFEIKRFEIQNQIAWIEITNTKFRSTAQAIGRISSTLQRFTADDVKHAHISFHKKGLQVAAYTVDLEKISQEQFNPILNEINQQSIVAIDPTPTEKTKNEKPLSWGLKYILHRLFNLICH